MTMTDITPAELHHLRLTHAPTVIPPCRVCGGPMERVSDVIDCRALHTCRTAADEHKTGWMIHYVDSKTTYAVNPKGDPVIIRLLDLVEGYQRMFAELEAIG